MTFFEWNWRSVRKDGWTDRASQDLRYALRGLARTPGFAVTVALTFALGIGANAAIFSLIDPLLLRRPPGVVEPDRVYRVYSSEPSETPQPYFSGASYTAIRQAVAGIARVAPKLSTDSVSIVGAAGSMTVMREYATADYLPMLVGTPALGRFFSADEADVSAPLPRAVLSHGLWQRAFASDRAVLGRTITLSETSYTIVGVAPKGFVGVDLTPVDVWVTAVHFARLPEPWYRWANEKFGSMILRMNATADDRQVVARGTQAYRRSVVAASSADSLRTILIGSIVEGRGPVASPELRISARVAGVAAILLLVACANIATLGLVRATRRRREIAVRIALGAPRARLVTQLLTETLLLAAIGSAAAVAIAGWGGMALRAILLPETRFPTGALTVRVAAATVVVSVFAGLLSGLVPALTASRPNLTEALRSGSRWGPLRGATLRGALLVAQGALSVVLLVGAGLFLRSLSNVHAIDIGLDPTRTIIASVRPARSAGFAAMMQEFALRARPIPGVEHVALGTSAPFVHWDARDAFLPGHDTSVTLAGERPAGIGVDTAFFRATGMQLRAGRGILATDVAGAPNVVVVSETMARTVWPAETPIGKCIIPYVRAGPCFTVVGVVSDLHQWSVVEAPRMRYFVPLQQVPPPGGLPTSLVIRASSARASAIAAIVHAEMQRTFPTARIMWPAAPVAQRLEPELRPWRVGAGLFVALGALALLVATIGIYSVIAYSFSQRTHEIGVRMALGARSRDVHALVLGEGLRVVAMGVGAGIVLALVLGRLVASLLFGVSSYDPLSLVASAGLLTAAGALAALLPAVKAARVDPVVSLRSD
jgi:predicted permease